MADLQRAFMSLPPVTRTVLGMTAAVTVPPLLALVSPYQLVFYWPAIRQKFQLWRLVTPFFYAGSGLSALFNFFFLFRTTKDLEDGVYRGRSSEFAWALTVMGGTIIALNYPLRSVLFFRALLLALTHLWAQFSPEQPMNLYGFITIPAKYLSYALLGLDLLQGGLPVLMEGLTGIISAHAFHYLSEVYPRANPNATRILETPAWFRRIFGETPPAPGQRGERTLGGGVTRMDPPRRPNAGATANAPAATAPSGRGWGSGRRLGD